MKRLRYGLVVLALLVWGRVVQVLVLPHLDQAASGARLREDPALPVLEWDSIRCPFPKTGNGVSTSRTPLKQMGATAKRDPVAVDSTPPPVLQAILWGPDPVAILVLGANSEILHKGQSLGGWTLQSIAEDRVWIAKGSRKLELVDR